MTQELSEWLADKPTLRQPDYARQVISAMSDAVLVLSSDLRIVTANDAAFELLSYEREQLVGAYFDQLFPEPAAWIFAKLGHPGSVQDEVGFLLGTGQVLPIHVSLSEFQGPAGAPSMVIVLRDHSNVKQLNTQLSKTRDKLTARAGDLAIEVARRKRVEEELRVAKKDVEARLDEVREQLLRLERLATLGTLAGGVGHELNNVATIQHYCVDEAAMLVAEGILDKGFLNQLETVDQHLAAHAKRLLNLARPGPDFVEPVDLRTIIRQTLGLLHGSGRTKYVDVESDLPETELMVRVNRTRIEQILMNLVGNAADALDGVAHDDACIWVRARPNVGGSRILCQVRDTGPGMSDQQLERIFEPFYTTKGPGKGTGLGLPVVKHIVESYGGRLQVDSRRGRGTTFEFDLPAATEPDEG